MAKAKRLSYEYYGMMVIACNGREYAIGSEDKANKAVREYIQSSVWAFKPEYLASHSVWEDIDGGEELIKLIQEKCEDGNDALIRLIQDFDGFFEEAVGLDGRGHFLATYDGYEMTLNEIDDAQAQEIADLLEIERDEWINTYVYRLN